MAYFMTSILCVIASSIFAKDLGVRGHTFTILEDNMLHFIEKRLQSFDKEVLKKMQIEAVKRSEIPKVVPGLRAAKKHRTFYFDPTICTQLDITDHQGNIIVPKGKCINPLDTIVSLDALLFFDGTNPNHLKWAKQHKELVKWILTKGDPSEIEMTEDHPTYFDQFGFLVEKFGIRNLPAKISRDGARLKIEEIPVGG